jgi:exodeoxyribonuclease-3
MDLVIADSEERHACVLNIFGRKELKSIIYGHDVEAVFVERKWYSGGAREGRTIVAEYDDFVLITAYFPNGGYDHSRVPFKMAYKADFLAYCNQLRREGKPVIFCGDVNTAHQAIDLARPRQNRRSTGFLPEERAWLDEVVAQGYKDSFRSLYPERTGVYSWWATYSGAQERNVGWRLDYFFVSPEAWPRVVDAAVHADVLGSDHCPVSLTLG